MEIELDVISPSDGIAVTGFCIEIIFKERKKLNLELKKKRKERKKRKEKKRIRVQREPEPKYPRLQEHKKLP